MSLSLRTLITSLCVVFSISAITAEGTRQLAPNADTNIEGTITNDIAALHLDNSEFNNFASYGNPNTTSRLHIHIADPSKESIFLGFSNGNLNGGAEIDFEYRILDPNGNIVFGPIRINDNDVGPGIINNWEEAFNGPTQLNNNPLGYDALQVLPSDLSSQGWTQKGDYYIEFNAILSNEFLIDFWDISVADISGVAAQEKLGRLWSNNWALFAINDFGFPDRPFNGSFYVCSPDVGDPDAAFVTKIDFNGSGFRPAAFNIAFNSFGVENTGDIIEDRKSYRDANRTTAEYAIFLNDPIDICKTATLGELSFEGINRCDKDDFCIQFISDKAGQVDVLLDFDGADDIYTPNTTDVLISVNVGINDINVPMCIDWNGQDGLGNAIVESASTQIPISISYAQGIYHFPVYDAELMTDGFNIETVRPPGPQPLLYYDDSNIIADSGSGEPKVQLAGCNLPCHRWTNYTDAQAIGFGNWNTINSWWFSQQTVTKEIFALPAYYDCDIQGPTVVCGEEDVDFEANITFEPQGAVAGDLLTINWSGPSITTSSTEENISVDESGIYEAEITWITPQGDTCQNSCLKEIEFLEITETTIDTLIEFGDSVVFNGEEYESAGSYTQTLMGANGCDSLLIINVTVNLVPFDVSCSITGPNTICSGEELALNVTFRVSPSSAPFPNIESIRWSGPSIVGDNTDNILFINGGGTYTATFTYFDVEGNLIEAQCSYTLDELPVSFSQIDTSLYLGESVSINGESFSMTGQYEQIVTNYVGCDSTITIVVNVVEPLYDCTISGPVSICENGEGTLSLSTFISPPNAPIPAYDEVNWQGPGLMNETGTSIQISQTGSFIANVNWTNAAGVDRTTQCSYTVSLSPEAEETISISIVEGDVVVVNGEEITEEGTYIQNLTAANGCDSILTIFAAEEFAVIKYDLDNCRSTDYSRFTPTYPTPLDCGVAIGSNVFRENPAINAHSCTPGVDGDIAMCVSALDDCTYQPGHEKSVIFEVTIIPNTDQEVNLAGLRFYEKAPNDFEWIVGETGPNNFPTKYGLRVLKDGVQVYSESEIETDFIWSLEDFTFLGRQEFSVTEMSTFRFELLPYCLVGKNAPVAAWDLDEITVRATCGNDASKIDIGGIITSTNGQSIPEVVVDLKYGPFDYQSISELTEADGLFAFENLPTHKDYNLTARSEKDYLNGVSTLDLINIQRHILGAKYFESPYQMIAGDIDNNQKLTAVDLIELRKLILGIYDELPENESWKFGSASQQLTVDNAWDFEEEVYLLNIKENINSDLVGIKIGDVTGDADASVIEKRSDNQVYLDVNFNETQEDLVKVDFQSSGINDFYGLEIFMSKYAVALESDYFNTELNAFINPTQSSLKICWAAIEAMHFDKGDVLFSVYIHASSENAFKSELLNGNSDSEIYLGENILESPIKFRSTNIDNITATQLFQNSPNPFSNETEITFYLENSGEATLNVFDNSGRTILTSNNEYSNGIHTIVIDSKSIDLPTGILYYQLQTNNEIVTKKMLVLD